VPRAEIEAALGRILRAVEEQRRPAVLTGPAGLGKTLLLHLVAERARRPWRPVYLPYATLSPEGLCAWALSALGEPPGDSPAEALDAVLRELRQRGAGVLLLVDDAGAMPRETAGWLRDRVREAEEAIGLVIAAAEHGESLEGLAELIDAEHVRLQQPMSEAESADYLSWRLARAGVPEAVRQRFGADTARRLHRLSGGNPRRLHIAASSVLRGEPAEIPEDWFADAAADRDGARVAETGGEETDG